MNGDPQARVEGENEAPQAQGSGGGRDFYVYVASRLSGDPGVYLANLHEICAACRRLMLAGYTVINPGADALIGLVGGEAIPCEWYHEHSLGYLRLLACVEPGRAAMYVLHGYTREGRISRGVIVEVALCRELGLPVCWSEEQLAERRGAEA